MIARLANLLRRFGDWLAGEPAEPPTTRVYEREFCDRSAVRLTLSTARPRYMAEFSEPPHPATLKDEFYPWRNGLLVEFQHLTGIEFSPREMANEKSRPLPSGWRCDEQGEQRRKRS